MYVHACMRVCVCVCVCATSMCVCEVCVVSLSHEVCEMLGNGCREHVECG